MIPHGSTRLPALSSAALAALVLLVLVPRTAGAGPKRHKAPPPACGIDYLPLAEGSQWTYDFFVPDNAPAHQGVFVQDPQHLTVKVVSVKKEGATTTITVQTSYRKVSVTTQLTCDKQHLVVPPESFFFAGEPGGGLDMDLEDVQVTGDAYLDKGLSDTYEELKATAVRHPTEGSGAEIPPAHLEVERKMTVQGRGPVETATSDVNAIKVVVDMTGRAALPSQKDKPFNMPAQQTTMWFAPHTGLVRVETKSGQGWKLASYTTAADQP